MRFILEDDTSSQQTAPTGGRFTLEPEVSAEGRFVFDDIADPSAVTDATQEASQLQMDHAQRDQMSPMNQSRLEASLLSPVNELSRSLQRHTQEINPSLRPAPEPTMMERVVNKMIGSRGAVTPEAQAKSLLSFHAAQDGQTAKEFTESVGARIGPLERGLKDVGAGAMASGAGMLGFAARMIDDPAAQDLYDRADMTAQDLMPSDPMFVDKLMAGFGSTATFFIPGLGIAKGAQAVSSVAPKMGMWLGSSAAAGMEASAEAGNVYQQMLAEGKTIQEARTAADQVFWGNAALVGVTNRLGLFGDHGGQLARRSFGAAMEGSQEGAQQMISNLAQGKPTTEGAGESALIGAIVGGAMSGNVATPEEQAFKQLNKQVETTRLPDAERVATELMNPRPVIDAAPEAKPQAEPGQSTQGRYVLEREDVEAVDGQTIERAAEAMEGGDSVQQGRYVLEDGGGKISSMSNHHGAGDNLTESQAPAPESEEVNSPVSLDDALDSIVINIARDNEVDDFAYYGLRGIPEGYEVDVGVELPRSYLWDFDNDVSSNEEADGTSTIGLGYFRDIGPGVIERAIDKVKLYGGDQVVLVKGDKAGYGDAVQGEVLIDGAIVLESFSKLGAAPPKTNPATKTPEFKKWFGDSKVVDESGEPLVVYHGTKADFNQFDTTRQGAKNGMMFSRGIYLTENPEYANSMGGKNDDGANVMPVYVSLKNPKIFESYSDAHKLQSSDWKRIESEGVHDGVIIKDGNTMSEVIAFSPGQIKSSTGNRGTFDPDDARIDYSQAPLSHGEKQKSISSIEKLGQHVSYAGDTSDSAGTAYQPMYQAFQTVGFERPEAGTLAIGNRIIDIPKPSKPMRRESIRTTLTNIIGPRLYEGKIRGQRRLGFYRHSNSEVRVKQYGDIEVMAHEMAHYLDFHHKFKKQFQKAYREPNLLKEVAPLSYTDDPQKQASEGFAEFVRLWLTRHESANKHAPNFTARFEKELAKDRALMRDMNRLQRQMHQWYYQGSEARLAAVMNGNKLTPKDRVTQTIIGRPLELMRQRNVDHIHAAKVVEREAFGGLKDAKESPFKQLQLINGVEGIFEQSMQKGAPLIKENGSIGFRGPSIYNIFSESIRAGRAQFEAQQQYFVARRAKELKAQGRENLLDEGMIQAGLNHAIKYPEFVNKFELYQRYRANLMEFMVDTGYLEPKAAMAMMERNKSYVPFNRAVEGVSESFAGSGNFQRLKGGTQNLKNIFENIVMGDFEHIKGSLRAKALRDMYQAGLNSQEGSKFFARIAPDSKPVKAHVDQMVQKVSAAMIELGIPVARNGNIEGPIGQGQVVDADEIRAFFEGSTEELMFWSFGHKPNTAETKVDSFIDPATGDRVWIEFQKDSELLTDMIDNLNGWALPKGVFGKALGFAYAVKNFQTALITSMPQFSIPNLMRDIQQATLLSGGRFKPVYHNMLGFGAMLGHAMGKNTAYTEMLANGGGWGTRVRSTMQDTAHGVGFRMPGRWGRPELFLSNLLDLYVSLIDSPEMSTRAGYYIQRRKSGVGARESAWEAREISTDFRKHGSYAPFVMLQRTIPFHGAFVQSVDRDIRAFAERKGEAKLTNLIKTETGTVSLEDLKVRMAIVAASFASITLLLASMNEDEDWYQDLTEDERVRFFHIKVDGEHYTIPKPHGFNSMVLQGVEAFMDHNTQKENADVAKVMAYSLAYNLNSDFLPGVVNPIVEKAMNKNFTGAPIIGRGQENLSPPLQYTEKTPQAYIELGRKLNISPDGARHIMRGYTGYMENLIAEVTDAALWNEHEWGERPFKAGPKEMFGKQFLPRDVPYRTRWIEKYYDMRGRAITAQSDISMIQKRLPQDSRLRKRFDDEVTHLLDRLNEYFRQIDGQISEMRETAIQIRYDPGLSAAQKEDQINSGRRERNEMVKQFYLQALKPIEALEKRIKDTK